MQTTKEKIDEILEWDNGRSFRKHLKKAMANLSDAFDDKKDEFRAHLGASIIGRECARQIWMGFRFAEKGTVKARMIRLFNRGHLEEARFEAMLRMIGCDLWTHDANGVQWRFQTLGGHFCGSLDGIVKGVPEDPKTPMLCEFKTHSEKSFSRVLDRGVLSAKLEHFVQMQIYMKMFNLSKGLYMAVNKNNDDLYTEIVPYKNEVAEQYLDRARKIIFSEKIPPRISDSPGWWVCKMCSLYPFCFEGAKIAVERKTCRTCVYIEPIEEGGWVCNKNFIPVPLPFEEQVEEKRCHRLHPDLR